MVPHDRSRSRLGDVPMIVGTRGTAERGIGKTSPYVHRLDGAPGEPGRRAEKPREERAGKSLTGFTQFH